MIVLFVVELEYNRGHPLYLQSNEYSSVQMWFVIIHFQLCSHRFFASEVQEHSWLLKPLFYFVLERDVSSSCESVSPPSHHCSKRGG